MVIMVKNIKPKMRMTLPRANLFAHQQTIRYLTVSLPELCFAKPGDRPNVQYKVDKAEHSNQDSWAEIILPVRDNDVEDVDLEADQSGL